MGLKLSKILHIFKIYFPSLKIKQNIFYIININYSFTNFKFGYNNKTLLFTLIINYNNIIYKIKLPNLLI